jgi:Tol biopolymer transport system component
MRYRWLGLGLVLACHIDTGPRAPVATLEVSDVPAVWVGDLHTLQATPRAADGSALQDRAVTWTSSDPAVASVDAFGVLRAHTVGTVTIAGTCEGQSDEITVVVSDMDLIYEGYAEGGSEILLLSLVNGESTRLLPAGSIATDPVPSPDGQRVAFVIGDVVNSEGDIWVVNRDGTGLLQLTFDPELDDNPAWSPDGTLIAFRSHRTQGLGDIWVMNADGSGAVNLTPDPLPGVTDERRPTWSPDGAHIAFASNRAGNMDIWTMRADGTDFLRRTNTIEYDTEPTWSPDGSRIAFRRSDDRTSDILILNVQGTTPVRLQFPGHELMPSWSPNGAFLAFAYFSPTNDNPQIYTVRPDGTDLQQRSTDPAWPGAIEPAWIRR